MIYVFFMLIEAGAHVNIKDKYGNTTLIKAVTKHNENYVSMLIEAGADVNVTNGQGPSRGSISWICSMYGIVNIKGKC